MKFSDLVLAELARARRKHPKPQNSLCEAREVIREEFDEFVEASRKGKQSAPVLAEAPTIRLSQQDQVRDAAIRELVETAAMCLRTAIECYGFPEETP